MICPHCSRTIAEQDTYLMSKRHDGPIPAWGWWGLLAIGFVILVGILALARQQGAMF